MTALYSLGIRLYILALYLASPFNQKAKRMLSGRKNWVQKLKVQIDPASKYIWFHCSSLGEFEQGRPLIESAKRKFKNHKIVLSFFSPSGYEIRKNYEGADVVCYMPFDTRRNATIFIDLFKPEKVFFVKYEYWHFFLKTLQSNNIPTYLISAIFRENQVFFKWYGSWFRKILDSFTWMFVQDGASQKLLNSNGITKVSIAGDTRFDRVADIVRQKRSILLAESFKGDSNLLIAGSSWPADEAILCNFINQAKEDVKFIIAPHEVHKSHIEAIQSKLTVPFSVFSELDERTTHFDDKRVLIVDTIGILSSLYQYGDIGYIGGGFGVGIHNTLEAATYGMPVIFGPNYKKFREAVQLIECGGAFTISNEKEFNACLNHLLTNPKECMKSGKYAGDYVASNTGATRFILDHL